MQPMKMKRGPIFYGWWIVGAAVIVGLYVGGIVVYGFTAIFDPIVQEFGWSYAAVSFAASLRGAESGLLEPVVGRLVDRWGVRRLIFAGGLFTAGGLFLLSNTNSLAMFYGSFILLAFGMSACGTTALVTGVATWFRERLGLATGIALCGFGLGGLILPVMVELIAKLGWRETFAILGAGALVLLLPLSFVFRHRPEAYGCLPDGRMPECATDEKAEARSSEITPIEPDITLGQAARTRPFWLLTIAFTIQTAVIITVVTHVMPYLTSVGIARITAGVAGTAIPVLSIFGRLGLGTLGDKTNRTRVSAAAYVLMGVSTMFFAAVPVLGTWTLYAFLPMFGIGYGGVVALRPALTREHFSGSHFGSIFGAIVGINAFGGLVAPPLAGRYFDMHGNYHLVWIVLSVLALVASALVVASHWRARTKAAI